MSVTINQIEPGSIAFARNLQKDDVLISINGNEIFDVLDYRFYMTERKLSLELMRGKERFFIDVKKLETQELGLLFDTYLIDCEKRCTNNCVFCFVDQLPPNMRETLYFKDDDSRLSFLFGNYITLTNLSQYDIDRIIKMHISPVNISVHTTNKALRCKMMGNRFAGERLDIIEKFAGSGIKINAQIVVCKEYNSGNELKRTLEDLAKYYPSLESIAVVPVGLTKHRQGLEKLSEIDRQTAAETIEIVDTFAQQCKNEYGTRLAFCADEFYIKAEKSIPAQDFYEDFNQLDNGVGMCALLKSEFIDALSDDFTLEQNRTVSIVTGTGAYPLINELCTLAMQKYPKLCVNVYRIENDFFGKSIDVAGLITGIDIIENLKNENLGDELLLPKTMLRSEQDMFLDSVTLEELSKSLNVKCTPVAIDGYEFLQHILEI